MNSKTICLFWSSSLQGWKGEETDYKIGRAFDKQKDRHKKEKKLEKDRKKNKKKERKKEKQK